MSKNWLNISGKINEPFLGIYAEIANIAEQINLPFFIIGATARDLIFEHAYGIKAPRATRDVDLAVQVNDWQAFETLKSQLLETNQFSQDPKQLQRLLYRENIPVDIVPFGGVETNGSIAWPPEYSIQMTVTGFQEAYQHTQIVRLREQPPLDIRCVTPVGLLILKLIAWSERYPQGGKDASDIAFVLRNAVGEWNRDLLYHHHTNLLEDADFDEGLAGARMLGRQAAEMLSLPTLQVITGILHAQAGEQSHYRLVENMIQAADQFNQYLNLLDALYRGITEQLPQQG